MAMMNKKINYVIGSGSGMMEIKTMAHRRWIWGKYLRYWDIVSGLGTETEAEEWNEYDVNEINTGLCKKQQRGLGTMTTVSVVHW